MQHSNVQQHLVVNKNSKIFHNISLSYGTMQSVHPKLKGYCPKFQNINCLPYLPHIIDLDHLLAMSDISNYVDVHNIQ